MTVSYDAKTKKFTVIEERSKKVVGQKQSYSPRIAIRGELLNTLLGFAKQDGFTLTRKNKEGTEVQDKGKVTKAVGFFVNVAIKDFCRDGSGRRRWDIHVPRDRSY
ncbi:hypothetical protein ACFLTP_05375 [Chloroflexota bacterium]